MTRLEAPPVGGHFRGKAHILPVRIYYEDTDFSGVVYHANYVRYFERGRSEFLRQCGVTHADLAARDEPLAFTIRRMSLSFHRPARIDDLLEVRTWYRSLSGARIMAQQDIYRGEDHLVAAEVEAACISLSGRPRRMPADLLPLLLPFLGGEGEES